MDLPSSVFLSTCVGTALIQHSHHCESCEEQALVSSHDEERSTNALRPPEAGGVSPGHLLHLDRHHHAATSLPVLYGETQNRQRAGRDRVYTDALFPSHVRQPCCEFLHLWIDGTEISDGAEAFPVSCPPPQATAQATPDI